MRRTGIATGVLVAVAALAGGCQKDSSSQAAPAGPVDRGDVVAVVAIPSASSLGGAVDRALDRFKPGTSAQLPMMMKMGLSQMAGGPAALDGADLGKPVAVLVANPKKYDDPIALLVAVGNGATLKKSAAPRTVVVQGDRALIGDAKVIAGVKAYAFGQVARQQVPELHATVFPAPLLAAYRADIATARAEADRTLGGASGAGFAKDLVDIYFDAGLGLAGQTERVEVAPAVDGTSVGLAFTVVPRAGSTLARVVAVQRPGDFALLGKLPESDASPPVVMAGHLALGPIKSRAVAAGTAFIKKLYGEQGKALSSAEINAWTDLLTGDFAAVAAKFGPSMAMSEIAGVSDGGKALAASDRLLGALVGSGNTIAAGGMTIEYKARALTYGGVSVSREHMSGAVDGVPMDMTVFFSGLDHAMLISMGSDGGIEKLIDSASGKTPGFQPAGGLKAAIDAARARKESAFMYMDLSALAAGMPGGGALPSGMPSSVVLALGAARGNLVLRLALSP